MLLVTGPVTKNMRQALERTYRATPDPKGVVALNDCAADGGIFAGSYAVAGGVSSVVGALGSAKRKGRRFLEGTPMLVRSCACWFDPMCWVRRTFANGRVFDQHARHTLAEDFLYKI